METITESLRNAVTERREDEAIAEVTADVARVQLSIVNAYLVGLRGAGDRFWVLVDAGLYLSGSRIVREAARRFGPESRPAAIVLTHAHFDHVGALKYLAELWDVPVFAHVLELPYLTGRSSYPPPDPMVGGGAMAWMSPLFPRGPIDISGRVHALPEDGTIPGMPGWRWISTPGHTPGHVALFRDLDRTLIAGDAFITTRQDSLFCAVTQPEEINGPPSCYTPDWIRARKSVEKLADLQPEVAATGHGHPMRGHEMRMGLQALAGHFEELGVPKRGRYVKQPATANEEGTVFVPPSLVDQRVVLAAGFGVGLVAGALLGRRNRR